MARALAVVAWALACGCQVLYSVDGDAPRGSGATDASHGSDAAAADAPASDAGQDLLCGSAPLVLDDFPGGVPCQPWGSAFFPAQPNISEQGGDLVIAPLARKKSQGCSSFRSDYPLGSAGIVLALDRVPMGGQGQYVGVQFDGTPQPIALGVVDGVLELSTTDTSLVYGATSYDAARMRWIRLRQETGPSGRIVAESGSDAVHWDPVGSIAATLGSGAVNLIVSYDDDATDHGSAEFAHFHVCH